MITPLALALLLAWEIASTVVHALPLKRREEGGTEISFQYQGNTGPNLWPGFCQDLNPGQSPIDIRPGSADANNAALQASLQPIMGGKLANSGHGLEFTLPEGGPESTFVAAGQAEVFKITGFHIHAPSEHRFAGMFYDAEVHFVGASPSGKTSVMAVMFEVSEQPLANNLMSVAAQQLPLNGTTVDLPPFDLSSIEVATNNLTGFHTYVGSLTTPPCTTGVLWNVLDTPVPISIGEMLAIRREQGFTSRFVQVARDEQPIFNSPVQPLAGAAGASKEPVANEETSNPAAPTVGQKMLESIESVEEPSSKDGAKTPAGAGHSAQPVGETPSQGGDPIGKSCEDASGTPASAAPVPAQTAVYGEKSAALDDTAAVEAGVTEQSQGEAALVDGDTAIPAPTESATDEAAHGEAVAVPGPAEPATDDPAPDEAVAIPAPAEPATDDPAPNEAVAIPAPAEPATDDPAPDEAVAIPAAADKPAADGADAAITPDESAPDEAVVSPPAENVSVEAPPTAAEALQASHGAHAHDS